jgi:hypothetical protein
VPELHPVEPRGDGHGQHRRRVVDDSDHPLRDDDRLPGRSLRLHQGYPKVGQPAAERGGQQDGRKVRQPCRQEGRPLKHLLQQV